jgi:hypothetical protein
MTSKNRVSLIAIYRFLASLLIALSALTGAANAQNPVPLINQPLVPEAIAPGSAGFTLTVNGTGFASGAVVNWNGSGRTTTFVSGSRLTASILASDIATGRTASVTVVNPATGGGTSNVVLFQVTTANSAFGLAQAGYATAGRSYALAVGDFNGDGKPDLAVANYVLGTISVLLGNGNGTFQPHVDYATGGYPESVAVGDFNNDGKLDLVVANNGSNTVSILLGNGDGTFQPQVEYATGNLPIGVAVADFNRDGKLDLVVANYDNINVLLGNGDGTFQPAVNYAAGAHPGSPAVGDFNRDGKLDLVVANNSTNTITVLLGNGDGTFRPAVSYSTEPSPTSIAVADFNADDKLDLAVGAGTGVSVLLGNGDGTFQAHVDYGTGSRNPCSVAVGDFNGDGRPDLVVADLFSTDVHLLLGNGNGTFGAASTDAAGPGPSSVAVGDFNGDGSLDVAVADSSSATVSVLLQATAVLSSPSLAFGDQSVHTSSAPQSVTLTNAGPLTLTIGSIAITGADATDFSQKNTCGSSVPALGGSCTISVTFRPTVAGPRTASITITDNAQGSPQVVLLTGTGVVQGPIATLSASSLTFSTQVVGTSSTAQSVILTNSGSAALSITNVSFNGADPGDFSQTNTCGTSLAPGANCSISITFTPKLKGTRSAALALADDAAGNPQLIALSGTGTVVQLNPASLLFVVPPGQSASRSTTLTNVGSTTLSINGITLRGPPGVFQLTNTCGSSVAAGKTCSITVTFKPFARALYSADVYVYDNGGGSPQDVHLSGLGCRNILCR